MQFAHTIDKVRNGSKTTTSRIKKNGEVLFEPTEQSSGKWVYYNGRVKWAVGQILAAQPGRGMKATDHIKILNIFEYDVREITPEQVKAEGFESATEFWLVWCAMHDKGLDLRWEPHILDYSYRLKAMWRDACSQQQIPEVLANRPKENYEAWGLSFERVGNV